MRIFEVICVLFIEIKYIKLIFLLNLEQKIYLNFFIKPKFEIKWLRDKEYILNYFFLNYLTVILIKIKSLNNKIFLY